MHLTYVTTISTGAFAMPPPPCTIDAYSLHSCIMFLQVWIIIFIFRCCIVCKTVILDYALWRPRYLWSFLSKFLIYIQGSIQISKDKGNVFQYGIERGFIFTKSLRCLIPESAFFILFSNIRPCRVWLFNICSWSPLLTKFNLIDVWCQYSSMPWLQPRFG